MLRYKTIFKTAGAVIGSTALALGATGAISAIASADAMSPVSSSVKEYYANIEPLNNSGVSGTAEFTLSGNQLTVAQQITGLPPSMAHAEHIHGQLDGTPAFCPTAAQDTNHDGYISVVEGAPAYGPIKLNITTPQTPFGPNNTMVMGTNLYAPFAGLPVMGTAPTATAQGTENYQQTYTFDMSNPVDVTAYNSIATNLANQAIVIHGMVAPTSVDTAGGSSTTFAYDGLLPIGCGKITAVTNTSGMTGTSSQPWTAPSTSGSTTTSSTGSSSSTSSSSMMSSFDTAYKAADSSFETGVSMYGTSLQNATGSSSANSITAYYSANQTAYENFSASMTAAENQYTSSMQGGMNSDQARNSFIDAFNQAKANYFNNLEQAKNTLSDNLNSEGQAVAKDQFMDSFNALEATYSNQLVQAESMVN